MRVYLATKNAGKQREFEALFAGTPYEVATYAPYRDVVEGECDYAENAALKARALHEQLLAAGIRAAVLADDSGLEITALAGRPGVVTAYYGGPDLDWHERRCFVLDELATLGPVDRAARFVCVLHFIDADGRELAVAGDVAGEIAPQERGDGGFSFDPIFFYPPAGRTFAELSEPEKNAVSHRHAAVAQLLAQLSH